MSHFLARGRRSIDHLTCDLRPVGIDVPQVGSAVATCATTADVLVSNRASDERPRACWLATSHLHSVARTAAPADDEAARRIEWVPASAREFSNVILGSVPMRSMRFERISAHDRRLSRRSSVARVSRVQPDRRRV
ncbi:hypothetical protein AAFF_G00150130 [Aldrovandia affinis]|uniref:Uncharacterized protein n=1 Tax=Aldrovandia affinis TaxID=143900 RepID=A0AAD7R0U7_9TELE|nr:hypothetical protein AAFF_G00150130 [Aldrovandia affinis]